eukprot:m.123194 g.123194  ORF g.123194 m.123194 type:complete len:264 (-) comp16244_c2_seq9:1831-2622(-)
MTCHADSLTDAWGRIVQVLLGCIAFSILVLKRFQEKPRRPLKIWWFDTSKQALSAGLIHIMNVVGSIVLSSHTKLTDTCIWYFMSILLDSTIGLLVVYLLLRLSAHLVAKHKWNELRSGVYGYPPSVKRWIKQSAVYLGICILEKLLVFVLMMADFWQTLGERILSPLGHMSDRLETMFALLIAPFIINAVWFWMVDNFLMKAETSREKSLHLRAYYGRRHSGDRSTDYDMLLQADNDSDDDDSSDEDDEDEDVFDARSQGSR